MAETTYCVTSDYDRNPVPVHHYIQEDLMTDWGLPNQMHLVEVDPATLCRSVGVPDIYGRAIYEHDYLRYDTGHPERGICIGVVQFGPYCGSSGGTHLGFHVRWLSDEARCFRPDILWWAGQCKVVGNEFDKEEKKDEETGETARKE